MKKLLYAVLLIFVFSLSACDNTTDTGCKRGYYLDGEECVKEPDKIMVSLGDYTVHDTSEIFDFETKKLEIFWSEIDSKINYVDVEDFIKLLEESLIDVKTETSRDELKIIHTFEVDGTNYEYFMILNALDNTIYYNDFDLAANLSNTDEIDYEFDMELIDSDVSVGNAEKSIYLNDYDFDIVEEDGQFYMPLHLANLFLSGDLIEVMMNDLEIYIVEDFSAATGLLESERLSSTEDEEKMIEDTYNYLLILLDHFYGLSSEFEAKIDTFKEIDLEDITQIEDLTEKIAELIFELDDLHTTVLSTGFNGDSMELVTSPTNSRYTRFYTELYARSCPIDLSSTGEPTTYLSDYGTHYVLFVSEFNLNTKDELKDALKDITPNKDLYIDMSCNTGGNIVSVFDLLAYLTNEPIEFNYYNPATLEEYTETYDSDVDLALENNVYVYTSALTFSAANIFTHYVKEMELATVIGESTSGGSAAVNITILPNNVVMTYSSNMVITDDDFEPLEFQIGPDVYIGGTYDITKVIEELNQTFAVTADYNVISTSNSGVIDLELVMNQLRGLSINKYIVEIYNHETKTLIDSEEFTTNGFTFYKEYTSNPDLIDIHIKANFIKNGVTYSNSVYFKTVDSHPEFLNDNAPEIELEKDITVNKYNYSDHDFYKLIVTEDTTYKMSFKNVYGWTDLTVYDESGNSLRTNEIMNLQPGTYYIELYVSEIGDYTFRIDPLFDDNSGDTILSINEGVNEATVTYDFLGDKEAVVFTLTEEAIVTVSFPTPPQSRYFIVDEDLEKYSDSTYNRNPNADSTYVLAPGTYKIWLHNDVNPSSYTVQLDVTYLENDITGDKSLSTDNFGTLFEGTNQIVMDGLADRDIYKIEVTETTIIQLEHSVYLRRYLKMNSFYVRFDNEEAMILEPGTHYILFTVDHMETPPETYEVIMNILVDESSSDSPVPITLNVPFTTTIEYDNDIDYYTFSLSQQTFIELIVTDGHLSQYEIYNGEGEKVAGGKYGYMLVELEAGDYTLHMTEGVSSADEVYEWTVVVNEFANNDTEPEEMNLDESEYTILTLPTDIGVTIQSKLDIPGDVDVFLFRVTSTGTYQMNYNIWGGSINIYIDGHRQSWGSGTTKTLNPGDYYFVIDGSFISRPSDYSFTITEPTN